MFGSQATAAPRGAWRETLNASQLAAATHGDGPLLVVAGAGSGKTTTLACRVAYLVGERRVAPERLLLLTFTRRAAREMLARAAQHLGETGGPGAGAAHAVWGGTFHAVSNRLLRQYGRPLGIQPDFTVLDQADAADLMGLLREELGLASRERRFPRKETLADIYSRTVNARTRLAEVLEQHFPWCLEEADGIRQVFEAYTRRKRSANVLDYDDLLLYWAALARSSPAVGAQFEHVLVDEYQDTNALQAEILLGMRSAPGQPRNITVVGDDAQAIYSFRSATVRNILDFPQQFPGATVVKLERNYRSTTPILAASNAVIAQARERHDKTLWTDKRGHRRPVLVTCLDEAEQADVVCQQVLEHREQGVPLRSQAVLFRTGHHSDRLEVELARRNIPFVKYGGLKFLEAAHVKDLLSLLRVLDNPADELAWFRVLQLLDGVGPAGARRIMEALGVGTVAVGQTALRRLLEGPTPVVPSAAREDFAALRDALGACAGHPEPPAAAQVERLRRFLDGAGILARAYPRDSKARLRDLEQLEALAAGVVTRGKFVADLTLDPPASTADLAGPPLLDEDYLVLSTVHSAKGGEWDVVHVIHAADGMFPSDMSTGDEESVEEERRLFYVALTRAREALYVYFPLRYYHRPWSSNGRSDAHTYAQLTRFLAPEAKALFDQRSTPGAAREETGAPADGAASSAGGAAAADVDAFLRSLWG